ncbi:MAG: hypothetical protein HGA61_01020 [Candidatus Moranbacteria bacterium]|nr:hypothetical protein [Candidatus Moranbacteria bacterium]
MKNRKIYLFIFLVLMIFSTASFLFVRLSKNQETSIESSSEKENWKETTIQPSSENAIENSSTQKIEDPKGPKENPKEIESQILLEVPFVVQAPFANWKDADFQNGCEEASMVMTIGWLDEEKNISPTEAKKRILDIIAFENKTFGYSADTDVFDMQKIFKQYFKNENIKASENITLEDIKDEIQNGNIVLVPAFGRALKNPNFTQPGPIAHMLIIIGYDPATKEFITNDPGTRKGARYRYGENLLFEAIWAYPSGKDIPPLPETAKIKKAMISISKID